MCHGFGAQPAIVVREEEPDLAVREKLHLVDGRPDSVSLVWIGYGAVTVKVATSDSSNSQYDKRGIMGATETRKRR